MQTWQDICELSDLVPGSGVCAWFDEKQVAIFRLLDGEKLFALSNFDPIGHAYVLSRGITGSLKGRQVVASPLYKQHFDLQTGECVEQPEVKLPTWPVRVVEGRVQLARQTAA